MIIAFKNHLNHPDLANRLISVWTQSDWVHVEMLLQYPRQLAVSSRPSHGGITVSDWSSALPNASTWQYYEVPVSSEMAVWDFLLSQADKSFNWSGLVASQVFGASLPRTDSWFCSELTYATLLQYSPLALPQRNPAEVSPALLRQYLIDLHCPKIDINNLITL
ncbi:hypothetical protein GO755_33360 [Spirosoma sp. HMF4905]|uniref:Uncharacterized protein n=1 Tax=Spirosoma arboris TaxID=2682092 RepID=A0A7K1SME8_9BACT|nr:hypothetical protein [Spirosoma arboris]MVM34964.1 hypothetical protein [Spirosoma arboris]